MDFILVLYLVFNYRGLSEVVLRGMKNIVDRIFRYRDLSQQAVSTSGACCRSPREQRWGCTVSQIFASGLSIRLICHWGLWHRFLRDVSPIRLTNPAKDQAVVGSGYRIEPMSPYIFSIIALKNTCRRVGDTKNIANFVPRWSRG